MINENLKNINIIFFSNLKKINAFLLDQIYVNKFYILALLILLVILYYLLPYLKEISKKLKQKQKYNTNIVDLKDIKNKDIDIFLDVRNNEEYTKNPVSKATNIDYKDIMKNEKILVKNNILKDKNILIFCKSGRRSSLVFDKMINDYGYDKNKLFISINNPNEIKKILI